jgi:hypothetical protein
MEIRRVPLQSGVPVSFARNNFTLAFPTVIVDGFAGAAPTLIQGSGRSEPDTTEWTNIYVLGPGDPASAEYQIIGPYKQVRYSLGAGAAGNFVLLAPF